MDPSPFVWETHGIHAGTGKDHVQHGVDDLEAIAARAVSLGFPSLTFVIHSPRLTRFRYASERATDVKFIRGDTAYFGFSARMEELRTRFAGKLSIRFGVELEWLGTGLGMEWTRAKLFQAPGVDFVILSVHFSHEGIPYDGSREDTERLISLRGGLDALWEGYFDEVIEAVDACADMASVVGHLDLPKLYAPLPGSFRDLDSADDGASHRLFSLLEMIAERSLALDVNLSGSRKGVGIYPIQGILTRARRLGIPIALGTDTHNVEDLGKGYPEGIRYALDAGYRYYVSFSRGIPEKRPLAESPIPHGHAGKGIDDADFRILNMGIEMLNQRFDRKLRLRLPHLSFGGGFKPLARVFPDSASLGSFHALRVRRRERSLTLTDEAPHWQGGDLTCLFSHHTDTPGTLAILLNTLASEEINVETAYLNSGSDGTATAYLTLNGPVERIREAVEFVLGTAGDRFFQIEPERRIALPPVKKAATYLLEVDGVWLPIPVSRQMVITVHSNTPGVLLVLLSALASRGVNVMDLQLGARGDKGFAALGVEGEESAVAEALSGLGPHYFEASKIVLGAE